MLFPLRVRLKMGVRLEVVPNTCFLNLKEKVIKNIEVVSKFPKLKRK